MFGGQDDNAQAPQTGGGAPQQNGALNGVDDLASGLSSPAGEPSQPPAPEQASDNSGGFMPTPSEPQQSSVPAPGEEAEDIAEQPPAPSAPAFADHSDSAVADSGELLELKQQALQQLTPIVGHLDQTPEEKFRTTMMLIQASDNQALLKEAYDAANAIEDEKVKAQALLDVVNEINYFTQNKNQEN
jgi:hypothetical protein